MREKPTLETSTKKKGTGFSLSPLHISKLKYLSIRMGMTKTDVIRLLIDREHEIKLIEHNLNRGKF